MAVSCPRCGRPHDRAEFRGGHVVVCDCGIVLRGTERGGPRLRPDDASRRPRALPGPNRREAAPRSRDPSDERTRLMEELKRRAERLCVLILRSDYPHVDIAIERARLREWCQQAFPDRMDLYDMIYESRFDRLIEQFGEDRDL